jgi:hypothetical protein
VITAKLFDGTYYLVLSGCAVGAATIHFQHLPVGSGRFVAITPTIGSQRFSGALGTTGDVTSTCCSDGPEDTYWWRTCPEFASTSFHASTCGGATFDTELDQRSAARAEVSYCNNDACGTQSQIDTTIDAGAGLHTLYVDSCGVPMLGDYSLALTFGDCAGASLCAAQCFDLQTDLNHCGTCTTACTTTEPNAVATCVAGACGIACTPGFGDCNSDPSDGCESPIDTVDHCGSCTPCSTNNCTPACVAGTCMIECNIGWSDCDGVQSNGCEVNLLNDRSNCGACGHHCNGSHTCTAGTCI